MIVVVLRTKPSGLYRHRRGLGLHRVGYKGGDLHIRIAKLAFHAKESPIRTRDEVLNLLWRIRRRNPPCNAVDNLRAGLILIEAWFRGY